MNIRSFIFTMLAALAALAVFAMWQNYRRSGSVMPSPAPSPAPAPTPTGTTITTDAGSATRASM